MSLVAGLRGGGADKDADTVLGKSFGMFGMAFPASAEDKKAIEEWCVPLSSFASFRYSLKLPILLA